MGAEHANRAVRQAHISAVHAVGGARGSVRRTYAAGEAYLRSRRIPLRGGATQAPPPQFYSRRRPLFTVRAARGLLQ